MDVLIEAGGSVHRVSEDLATRLAENLRAFSSYPETAVPAANKLERVLVEGQSDPLTFTSSEASTVARAVDHMRAGHPPDDPDLLALFSALRDALY